MPPRVTAIDRSDAGRAIRTAGRAALADALVASRRDTLSTFARCEAALPGLQVPQRPTLNPPLWELGHIGWFQERWIARHAGRGRGAAADPDAPLAPGVRADGDALYDSSRVPHASRWTLPLPDADATRADLARQLEATLARLADAAEDDDGLYFFRLALLHEDMHHEAALYMADALGVAIDDARWQPAPLAGARDEIAFDAGRFRLGHDGPGFVFDNERAAHEVALAACRIDRRVVSWGEVLPFVEAGGYADPRWWSAAGRDWLARQPAAAPRALRSEGGRWRRIVAGRAVELDPALPADHLSFFEAEAWCAWAGRRLPSEAEWERAAIEHAPDFDWGAVWEWTASAFAPYPGFVPHPYRDYSAPWFDGRPVLRGASFATQPRMRHPRYRNYFTPERSDLFAGFRTCAR